MSSSSLKERMSSYEDLTDFKLMNKLPVIITINGRGFKKTTSLMAKPYSLDFMNAMCSLMVKLFQEIDGSVLGYCFNDEIVLILKNDQNQLTMPWHNNNIQKISSSSASMATIEFVKILKEYNLNMLGDAVFTSQVFTVPNIMEAINIMIYKQQCSYNIALYLTCFYELIKKYEPSKVKALLLNKSVNERLNLLSEISNIDFNNLSLQYRMGALSYRIPKVVETQGGSEIKNKIIIDDKLSLFSKDYELIKNILTNGKSIIKY